MDHLLDVSQIECSPGVLLPYWHELERVSGFSLTLHDHVGAFSIPDRRGQLLPGANLHRSPCCEYQKGFRRKCLAHCSIEAGKRAAEGKPFRFCCWCGVTELVMPLFQGKIHAATIFIGAFRDPDFDLSGFPSAYSRLYRKMPVWDESKMRELSVMMTAAGYSLLQLAGNLLERYYVAESGRKEQIRRFFQVRYKEQVGVSDLAKELNLSESRISHLLHEFFGKSFSDLINEQRIRAVQEYLVRTDLPLREIAAMTGFRNEYYLSTVFRKIRKCPPGSIRRRLPRPGAIPV